MAEEDVKKKAGFALVRFNNVSGVVINSNGFAPIPGSPITITPPLLSFNDIEVRWSKAKMYS